MVSANGGTNNIGNSTFTVFAAPGHFGIQVEHKIYYHQFEDN